MLKKAQSFADHAHRGQKRKSSNEDYIVHPIRVARTLEEAGASKELICAGYLHDVVEDTSYEIDDIEREFGAKVRRLVASHTEDKTKSWLERKSLTIETVKQSDKEVKFLIVADKLDNLSSIENDRQRLGEEVWRFFKAGYDMQKWYYQSVDKYMLDGMPPQETPEFFMSYRELVQRVFSS
nr:HD domain-containing protein [Halobacillus sp. Marseille-Q1614]